LIREADDGGGDASSPAGFEESITMRAVHELLFAPAHGFPFYPALVAARAAVKAEARALVWIDPAGTFYPPAVAALGIAPEQVYVLRPRGGDVVWATAECLRCQGVGAVVAVVGQRLSRVEVRRLQLAAERGSGVGVLLRPSIGGAGAGIYAAATRWLVTPAPGARAVQRWRLELVHGHGGQTGQSFILEKHRASGQAILVRPPSELVRHAVRTAAS
jgi:protein ImuA